MFPFRRPAIVPPAFWRQARPVRVMLWVLAVGPMLGLAAGSVLDGVAFVRGDPDADWAGWFLRSVQRGAKPRLLPTATSLALFALALTAACGGAVWYASLKRRAYHRVWKSKFLICTTCGGAWLPCDTLFCPQCAAPPPRIGLERAWKEWYDSTHDEPTLEFEYDEQEKAARWMSWGGWWR